MIPLIGESKNLLTAGKVIGPIKDPSLYHSGDKFERGEIGYQMGRSDLMEFYRCPHRWRNGYTGPDETKSTEWGDLVDCLYLTPNQFKNRYAVQPETYLDTGMLCPICKSVTDSMSCKKCKTQRVQIEVKKDWNSREASCAEWESSREGMTIINHKLFQPACDAVKILQDNSALKSIKECSTSQVMATAAYQDEETGIVVPLGILIDLLPSVDSPWGKSIIDLKTTTTAAMRPWRSSCYTYNYDAQAALYLDVWSVNTGEDRQDFRHIIQESFHPYQTEMRLMSAEFIEIGRLKYVTALKRYCQCLKTGIWPGYDSDCRTIDGWQLCEPEPWMVQ